MQRSATSEATPSARQLATELLTVFGLLILGITIFLWWHYVVSNPKRVFQGMLNNALQTPSANVHITQSAQGQTLEQRVDFQTGGQHFAHGTTTLAQPGSRATTETIGTPQTDYVRYTNIGTSQASASGKPLNFDAVLNVWGKTGADPNQTNGQLYNQLVLGVIPFGNLSGPQRSEVLKRMQSVYQVSYASINRGKLQGRPTYTYRVLVVPEAYVIMLKQYGKATGLTQLEQLDPARFKTATPISFDVKVDVWSRQIRTITYLNNNRTEQFSQMGRSLTMPQLPTRTISIDELQAQLQTVQ